MLVNSIPFQCVKKSQQGFTHNGSSTQIFKNSKLEPINLEHLRTWSCLISNHNAQNAQLKAIIQPGNRKRLTVLAWTVFVLVATQYSKPWVVISIFAHAKNHKFFRFVESDKDLHDKIREDMTGGPSIVFTRKAVVDQTYIRNSENICKSIVGIDASQLYPFSICQEMPTGLYTQWQLDKNFQKFKARTNKPRTFENMVMSYLQSQRAECTIESYYTTGKQKKIDCFSVDGFLCSLLHSIRSHGLLFPFLPMPRITSFSDLLKVTRIYLIKYART